MNKNCGIISTLILTYAIITNAIVSEKSYEDQWKIIKQRVALFRELKSRFRKKTIKSKNAQSNFIPQSLVHLQSLFGKDKNEDELISYGLNTYEQINPYGQILNLYFQELLAHAKKIIDNERIYSSFYVFYHGQKFALGIINDLVRELFSWFNLENSDEQTQFLRIFAPDIHEFENVDDFLSSVKNYLLIETPAFDHRLEVIQNLLPVNLALFGNLKSLPGENTWYYYMMGRSLNPPEIREILMNFFKDFSFSSEYIDKIITIHQQYLDKLVWQLPIPDKKVMIQPGVLLQIFVNPELADEVSYLSRAGGYPYSFEVTNSMLFNESYKYEENEEKLNDPQWKISIKESVSNLYEKIFDTSLSRPSVSKFLKIYRDNLSENEIIPYIIDTIQARIYLKYSLFINPKKIKIINYIFHPNPELVAKERFIYQQKLAAVVEKIIHDWLFEKKDKIRTRLERLFDFMKKSLQITE